ncbi:MAG: alcohol dehydrogenase catalytic domain-containing protein [Myxococcota bacterium]
MKALVFENSLPRLAATKLLSVLTSQAFVGPLAPLQMREIPDPPILAPDWVVIRTRLCGLCGSDYKQVFLNGATDNAMTAFISFPQVLGHEVVGVIEQVGPAVRQRRVGERVVLNPWLSCRPRGLEACEWCRAGQFAQCENFTRGHLSPGIHSGNSRQATGGFAPRLPAHESQCIPVPGDVSDEAAVLADPFAVSFHSLRKRTPQDGAVVLVYGCGTLGLLSIAMLRVLHPTVRVLAIARFPHQQRLAESLGAWRVLRPRPTGALVVQIGELIGSEVHKPWRGLPVLNRGVDVIYDSVGSPESIEVGVRVTRSRGAIVVTGVEKPRRFEWTPLYFKEIALLGSNAFGLEEVDGRRQHAFDWYFEFLREKKLDVTSLLTHRFSLSQYREAFLSCRDQGESGAVKVFFDHTNP